MPIVRDSKGCSTYVPFEGFFCEKPLDFFTENQEEYRNRLTEARVRVLEVIRFASRPLWGRGLNHEVFAIGSRIEDLANFVDENDRRRCEFVRQQRTREAKNGLPPGEYRLRSPQKVSRRRRALFRHSDIPKEYFAGLRLSSRELDMFVDLMRWYLIEAAVTDMFREYEIECVNDIWAVKVSVMDNHEPARRDRHRRPAGKRGQVKYDDHSWHGRPQRDRKRLPAQIAA
jgi:hypothetical protein